MLHQFYVLKHHGRRDSMIGRFTVSLGGPGTIIIHTEKKEREMIEGIRG
jgi:hypothetical protein